MNTRRMPLLVPALLACALQGCAAHAPGSRVEHSGEAASHTVTPAQLAERGLLFLERGEHVRAEQYLQLALRAGHPAQPLIVPLLTSCIASNRFRSALAHAERHIAQHEHAWHVRFIKAALHRALGQPDEAAHELERALAEAPLEAHSALKPKRNEVSSARPTRRPRGATR